MDQNIENKMDLRISPNAFASQIDADCSDTAAKQESEGTPVSKIPQPNAALSNVQSVAEEPLKMDEVLALVPKIADTLVPFLKDMEAYEHIFPDPVWNRLKELEKMSEAVPRLREMSKNTPEGKDIETWSCMVYKDDMRHWPQNSLDPPVNPPPIIEAFYDNFDTEANPMINATLGGSNIGDTLQRIVIKSDILRNELDNITSVRSALPFVVPPPFKLFIRFYPEIRAHLSNLENELHEANLLTRNSNETLRTAKIKDETLSLITEKPPNGGGAYADTEKPVGRIGGDDSKRQRLQGQLRVRIKHLKCLQDFIHSDLNHLIELRTKVEDRTLQTISFQNLWYLFQPGDVVVSAKSHSKVLHKVYSVTGGQKRTQIQSQRDIPPSPPPIPIRDTYHGNYLWDDLNEDEDITEEIFENQPWAFGTWPSFKLDGYRLVSNGNYIRPSRVVKKIKHYAGEVRIIDLDVYPVQFHPDYEILLHRIEERGRKYLKSAGHKSYDGYTVPRGRRDQREELQGDVFIDIETFFESCPTTLQLGNLMTSIRDSSMNGEVFGSGASERHYIFTNHEVDGMLTETFLSSNRQKLALIPPEQALESLEYLQLMPNAVPGYAFGLRKWCNLDIDLLSDIDRERGARDSRFNDLVIPDNFRNLLTGLVENHTSRAQRRQTSEMSAAKGQDNQQVDLVRGKGQGLIILLHGPPGSGKTSTAETIAAFTQRPLYSITCGDLGLEPRMVEESLLQHTRKADKWGCVLLLDEADVFLMQRNWQNVERNALVSVLLRQLEYYSGILFLTTNRPGVIDEAFFSRIHISLRYPTIDLAATKRMWNNILNRIEHDNETSQVKVVFDRDRLLAFAEQHYLRREKTGTTWNGRQIRNALQTAIALGMSQRMSMLNKKGITPEQAIASGKRRLVEAKLTRTNLTHIAQTARAFEDYMQHLRGNDSDLARQAEVRDDSFDQSAPRAVKDYGERHIMAKRADSFGLGKGTSAAKTSTSAGKSRQGHSRKPKNVSEDDDDSDEDLDERSDNSSISDADDSDDS